MILQSAFTNFGNFKFCKLAEEAGLDGQLPMGRHQEGNPVAIRTRVTMVGSNGLVVMGDDSCLKGRGFESRRRILEGHLYIFHNYF